MTVDAGMLEQVLWHIHNWFTRETLSLPGCVISDGAMPASIADRMLDGQWYRIEGSYLNDGLHRHPANDLTDEEFDATVSLLAPPRALLELVGEMSDWQERNGAVADGPYQSESFGGSTYSKGGSSMTSADHPLSGWRSAFADRLNAWRKIS